jgi:hypothetical protein
MPRKELISGEWKKVCSKADCHKAGIPQPIEGFYKNKSKKDGLESNCKKCMKAQNAAYHANNKESIKARKAEYRAQPEIKAHIKARGAEYRAQPEFKARKKTYDTEYCARPEIKARNKAQNAAYHANNKESIKAQKAEYAARPENKARANQRKRDRYHSDPAYRLRCIVSNSICQALKAKGKTKGGSTFDYLPYSPEGLAEHLEKQFDEHMTWDNHGTYWHIDHIRPHASFKYDSLDHPDFQKCWALENLRPLEASENIRKNSFWEGKRHYHNEAV